MSEEPDQPDKAAAPVGDPVKHGAGSADLGLTNGPAGLDIEDDRVRRIDQIIVSIGEEGRPAPSTRPLGRRI